MKPPVSFTAALLTLALAGFPASAASADEPADLIIAQARECLNVPNGVDAPTARLTVTFDADGLATKVNVDDFTPKGNKGQIAAQAFARAVLRCGPYGDAPETLTFDFGAVEYSDPITFSAPKQ